MFDFDRVMKSRLFSRKLYLCNDEFQGDSRFWVRALNRYAENENIRLQNFWDGIEIWAAIMTMKN